MRRVLALAFGLAETVEESGDLYGRSEICRHVKGWVTRAGFPVPWSRWGGWENSGMSRDDAIPVASSQPFGNAPDGYWPVWRHGAPLSLARSCDRSAGFGPRRGEQDHGFSCGMRRPHVRPKLGATGLAMTSSDIGKGRGG
jgi:hypothetical protein